MFPLAIYIFILNVLAKNEKMNKQVNKTTKGNKNNASNQFAVRQVCIKIK